MSAVSVGSPDFHPKVIPESAKHLSGISCRPYDFIDVVVNPIGNLGGGSFRKPIGVIGETVLQSLVSTCMFGILI
jgi:hypothetical protein